MPELTAAEWDKINEHFAKNPQKYGIPPRIYDSVVLAFFNIRKLGKANNRSANTWNFLGPICSHFDLIAIQEIWMNCQFKLEGFDLLRQFLEDI